MLRIDRENSDTKEILDFLESNNIVRLAFNTDSAPYIVPVCYGFDYDGEDFTIYFHGSNKGRKVELAKANPNVGFEIDASSEVKSAETACKFSMNYQSIIGTGKIVAIENTTEKKRSLNRIMFQFSGNSQWDFDEKMLEMTAVFKLSVDNFTIKNS